MMRSAVSRMSIFIATIGMSAMQAFSESAAKPQSLPPTISVPVYFLGATGEPLPAAAIPKDVAIELGAIAGSVGGNPDVTLQTIRIGPEGDVRINMADLSAKLDKHAVRFSERSGVALQLTPEVRFARVSTGASKGAEPLAGMAVVFWDPGTNGSLMPFYCDKRCKLTAPGSAEHFDVEVPSPGLGWMLTTKDQNSRFVHVRADNPRPVIIIAPHEALERISRSTLAERAL